MSDWVMAQEKRFANEPVIEEALGNPIQRERIDRAVEFIGGPGLKVLDVGCGDGAISELIHNNGNECYGVDLPDVVATVKAERTWLTRYNCDASRKPWVFTRPGISTGSQAASNWFDIVFAGEIIEHMIDIEPFFTEAYRVLAPGGRIVLTTPNVVRELNRMSMLLGNVDTWHEWDRIPHHVRYFTPETLALALTKYGFKPTKLSSGRSQAEIGNYVDAIPQISPAERNLLRKLFDRTMPNPAWRHSFIVMEGTKPR